MFMRQLRRITGRRKWLCFALIVVAFPRVSAITAKGEEDDRPNIVMFIADDVSWNDFGCYGNPAARTPNIDRLAEEGLQFTNAFLTASSCSPSRASIVTGRYPHNNGRAAELHLPIASNLPWFPELLREAGYYCILSGKNHMSVDPKIGGEHRPPAFDVIDPGRTPGNSGGHGRWVQHLQERPRDKPFFAWFASYDAHRGWDADKQWDANRYGPKHDPTKVVVPAYLVDDEPTRQDLASYYNEVTRFDYFVGRVVDELSRQGILENTLVFVLADNGRPFPRAKTRLHDSGMKTALIAHWPKGISHQGECSSLVSAIDLAPTILTAASVAPAPTMQGVPLQPLFADPSATVRQFAFSEHNWHDYEAHGRAVRDGQFLYIRNARPAQPWQGPADSVRSPSHRSLQSARDAKRLSKAQRDVFLAPRPTEELYATSVDPLQLNNLAQDPRYRNDLQRLRKVLDQWIDQTGDSVPDRLSADAFDRETGERLELKEEMYRGITPGLDRNAYRINNAGPR